MLKHTIIQLMISVLMIPIALCMYSCQEHDEPLPPEKGPADRTILVYMVANNDLGDSEADSRDIREMVEGASEYGNSRVLIFHKYRYTENGERKIAVQLKEIKPYGVDTLKIYNNDEPAVSVNRMREVIADVKDIAPAYSYGMVFWSHGSGWLQDGIEEDTKKAERSYGYDNYGNTSPMRMSITSLRDAIYDANLDFIYFDCCYMGSVETMYELRDCAPYIISSPAEIPVAGMPYHVVMPIFTNTLLPLENMAINAAQSTFNYYDKTHAYGDCPNTLAVIRTSALNTLADATKVIYSKAIALSNSAYSYQRFTRSIPCYYYDFGQYVESICTDPADMDAWRKALEDAVIYADASTWLWYTCKIEQYSGLSTYILSSTSSATTKDYNTLSWYADVASALFN